ncbi:MAG: copper transporter [Solirubrobacterales bacterium]
MGYSARYHAASLAAVFLALAVGILIGAGLGDNVVSGTEENLQDSLEGDIEEARAEQEELRTQLQREQAFSARAYPALVGDALDGRRIGVLAIGQLPADLSADVEAALEPTGGELAQVAVVRMPPDTASLASSLGGNRSEAIQEDPGELEALGRQLGAQFTRGGGKQLEQLQSLLFVRSSGEGGRLDGVILVRPTQAGLDPADRADVDALASGLVGGVADSGEPAVAVERSGVEESSIGFFQPFGVTTVDSADLTSGKVALVFGLLGAKGSFGIKDTANSLLPELLVPSQSGR